MKSLIGRKIRLFETMDSSGEIYEIVGERKNQIEIIKDSTDEPRWVEKTSEMEFADIKMPEELTKEELKHFGISHYLTVGRLKKYLEEHPFDDDSMVVVERVADHYYETGGWKSYYKENEHTHWAREWNEEIDKGTIHKTYPRLKSEQIKKHSEERLQEMKTQYHPIWCCVRYGDDKDILFLDLHY